ncbi:MAG: hypothetical protein ACRCWF_09575 [Beijerinckiaceae bacterium]
MSKDAIATLSKDGRRFELTFPEYGLTVRGPYVEWVLEASAEIISKMELTKAESTVEEMQMLKEFGDSGTSELEIESAKYEQTLRFETVPQCVVTMNEMDYRWVSKVGRKADNDTPMQRLHDISLTRNGSFLINQQ